MDTPVQSCLMIVCSRNSRLLDLGSISFTEFLCTDLARLIRSDSSARFCFELSRNLN